MAKILCVEDEMEIRLDLAFELSEEGYEVIQAENGKEGLKAIIEEKPDLVLCDVSMPVMDGHELLNEVRENYPDLSHIPFVFVSALADKKDQVIGKKLGADDYLTKPMDYSLLLATVEARLRQIKLMTEKQERQMVRLYKTLTPSST